MKNVFKISCSVVFLLIGIFQVNAAEKVQLLETNWSFKGLTGKFDRGSLQRGYQVYTEVCASCYSMKYVSYRNLAEPGGPEFTKEQAKAIASNFEVEEEQVDIRFGAQAVRVVLGGEWVKSIEKLKSEAINLNIDISFINHAMIDEQAANLLAVHIDLVNETQKYGSPIDIKETMKTLETAKKLKENTETVEDLKKSFSKLYDKLKPFMRRNASDGDEISSGYGPFGLCKTNPIPTIDIASSNKYLEKLQLKNKTSLTWERMGSTASEVTSGLVDIYQIKSNGDNFVIIYICPYHRKNSEKAPKGFFLN